jgi:ribosomal protein S18 acetylase RimI-like enzyme
MSFSSAVCSVRPRAAAVAASHAAFELKEECMKITELDNPAWSALTSRHSHLAIGDGPVRRYPAEVSPFAAVESIEALPILAERMADGETAVLWSPDELDAPEGLDLVVCFPILQMAAFDFRPAEVNDDAEALTSANVNEMIELTTLMKPGPFGLRTIEMGNYIGLHENGRLAAMAGERMKLADFTEISAICVHPDFQGRGHARRLTSILGKRIIADGCVPFLNVLPENVAAIALYESLGFTLRRQLHVHLLRRPGGELADDPFFSSL